MTTLAADSFTHDLELQSVCKVYRGAVPVPALSDVSLRVARGESIAVTGRSGSGKSTLLHIIGLLDVATSGTYQVRGVRTDKLAEAPRAGMRTGLFGFVFQAFHLVDRRTVRENIDISMIYTGMARAERRERAEKAIADVGLWHRKDADVATLSGGERQRVALARALAKEVPFLLCDEPTGNLDSETTEEVLGVLDNLHQGGTTVVTVTHDSDVAARATRRVRLHDGRIVSDSAA